jgi:hypothetical protein
MAFAKFLGPQVTFYYVKRKDDITASLDTKIKIVEQDPDRKHKSLCTGLMIGKTTISLMINRRV